MSNIYHILFKIPCIDKSDISKEYLDLANRLANSGRMRIDTGDKCNFAKFTDPDVRKTFFYSYQELKENELFEITKSEIRNVYSVKYQNEELAKKVNYAVNNLNSSLKKCIVVEKDLILNIAILLVQSSHPIVTEWILLDRTEVYVSYSHSIGDVMDIKTWKIAGNNSGMQSTNGKCASIFVSTGGDPFAKNSETRPDIGDGWAAVARMQIIAGQEFGHYADIIRDSNGNQIGRHSANFSCTMPTQKAKNSRLSDLKQAHEIKKLFLNNEIKKLIESENEVKFYKKNKVNGLKLKIAVIKMKLLRFKFVKNVSKSLSFVRLYDKKDEYLGKMLSAIVEDMIFNIEPKADVYSDPDKNVEEAIACAESLARVPQQCMKWGHITTSSFMTSLYDLYYSDVIPDLILKYEKVTSIKFKRNLERQKRTIIEKIKNKFSKNKNEIHFVEVRDL